jgi:hypothetical protein
VQGKWETLKMTVHRGTTAGQLQLIKVAFYTKKKRGQIFQMRWHPNPPEILGINILPKTLANNNSRHQKVLLVTLSNSETLGGLRKIES